MGCREQEVCQLRWECEVKVPGLDTSVFILLGTLTKTGTERIVVLNTIAKRVVDGRRSMHPEYVFTYRGARDWKPRSSAWQRGWKVAGLPLEKGVLKGAHNLRYTFGRRLRSGGLWKRAKHY